MHVGIGFVLELAGEKPTVRFCKFDRLVDHSDCTIGRRCKHHFGAEKSHELATLDTEGLCHRDNQGISFCCADHRKTNPGIAGRRLDHGLSRFEFSRFLRGFDNAERETVLDRTKGIERFVFYEEIDAFRRQLVDADYRCMADRFENVGKFCHRVFLRTSPVFR